MQFVLSFHQFWSYTNFYGYRSRSRVKYENRHKMLSVEKLRCIFFYTKIDAEFESSDTLNQMIMAAISTPRLCTRSPRT